jgi:hypothetical protein
LTAAASAICFFLRMAAKRARLAMLRVVLFLIQGGRRELLAIVVVQNCARGAQVRAALRLRVALKSDFVKPPSSSH